MPGGFFTKKETKSVSATGGKIHSCASCGLYKDCQSPKMKPYGKFEKDIMVIGESPGRIEDQKGKPWQGKEGRLLKRILRKAGIDLFRDCLSLNAVNCRPPDDRNPDNQEIDHCRSIIVWKTVMEYQPKVIILLGKAAIQSVIGHRYIGSISVNKWYGWTIPDQDIKAWVCPTFHPKYIQRLNRPKDLMNIWYQEISRAVEMINVPFPRYKKPEIEVVEDLRFLNNTPKRLSAFDYETTGIKPQAKGHQIKIASIASSEDHAWVFQIPKSKKKVRPFRKWLFDKEVPKMAHNLKFEDIWSKEYLKVRVQGWEWDSMLAAHILDNRSGVTGLKFQTYANFGIIDYDSEISPYLKSVGQEDSGNDFNRINELIKSGSGLQQLMTYCGLDSVYEYRLAMKQMEELNYEFLPF